MLDMAFSHAEVPVHNFLHPQMSVVEQDRLELKNEQRTIAAAQSKSIAQREPAALPNPRERKK